MKTILVLIMISGISLCSVAQNEKGTTEFQKRGFNDKWQKDTVKYFSISPEFKTDTVLREFQYSQRLHIDPFQFNQPDSLLSFKNSATYELRMPVAGGNFYSKMPIAVPDSSVHYYLKVKRIPFVNPMEKNHK